MSKIIRIAIADDHQLVRSGMAMILRENPEFVVVQQAENGRVLLDGIEQSRPDVVLLDMDMPVLGGADTSGVGASLHGACFGHEGVRSVRLRSPLWKSSMSLLFVGVMRRKAMLAMSW